MAMLYADLANSTAIVSSNRQMAAKVFKAFLACCSRIINKHGGFVRSFDGDRVMGVFVGDNKNTTAAKVALKINWTFRNVVQPKLTAHFTKLKDGSLSLDYSTGIDSGEVLVVRGGVHGDNDLLWIGRAANLAAKLSDVRHAPYRSFITEAVYNALSKEAKYSSGKDMWTKFKPYQDVGTFYGSEWEWTP